MAVPKRKTSPSKRKMRRAHLVTKATPSMPVEDTTTGDFHRPHRMTKSGYYKGRKVIIKAQKQETHDHNHDENDNHDDHKH
ncbi:MAG: 50S ribosomal protein L32 [Sphingobacteriia bacterium]|nr:50S ribosomal protein L32 [Sphingobacteriia bacterium]